MISFYRYRVTLSTGHFQTFVTRPFGWVHFVLNFIGPVNGIIIYNDGEQVGSGTTAYGGPKNDGDRRIVIGRYFAEIEGTYSSIQVDELLLFNQMLTDPEVTMLSPFTT